MSAATLRLLTIPTLLLALATSASAQSEFWLQFTNQPSTTSPTPIDDTYQVGSFDAEAEVGRGEMWARSTVTSNISTQWTQMSFSFDDFVFSSSSDEPVDVQMNLRLEDLEMALSSPQYGSHAIWVEGLDGASAFVGKWSGSGGVATQATGVLAGLAFGASSYDFTLGPIEVPVNEPVRLGVKFLVHSGVQTPNGTTAVCNTAGRLTFANDEPAFLVPPGVTVNSVEAVIVDNVFKPAITVRVPQDFPTIQDALSSTGDGSTVEISNGTYFETLDLSGRDDVTLRAKGKVVIDAGFSGAPCLLLDGCEGVRVEKLRFVGGTSGVALEDSSDVLIEKCRFEGQLGDGLSLSGCTGVAVEKCRIEGAADRALSIGDSDDVTVEKTRIDVPNGGHAAFMGSVTDIRFERCRITGEGGGDGIFFANAADLTFERNKLTKLGGDGIVGSGPGIALERNVISDVSTGISLDDADDARLVRNKVSKCTLDAFTVEDGANVFAERNKATKPLGRGFVIDVDDSTFEGNAAKAAGTIGFEVLGTGNTFTKNKAAKSGQADLVDTTGGANTYAPDNKFKTVQLD